MANTENPTVSNLPESEEEDFDTAQDRVIEEAETRTRYSGPVNLDPIGEEEETVNLEELPGRGRAPIDLTPYITVLRDNFKKNAKRPDTAKVAWSTYVAPPEAVSSVKSRFNTAGTQTEIRHEGKDVKVGIRWVSEILETVQNPDGDQYDRVKLSLVAVVRAEGRGRKPGSTNAAK